MVGPGDGVTGEWGEEGGSEENPSNFGLEDGVVDRFVVFPAGIPRVTLSGSGLWSLLSGGPTSATVKRSFYRKGFYAPYVRNVKVYSRPWVKLEYHFAGEGAGPGTIVTENVFIADKQAMYEPYEFKPPWPRTLGEARIMRDTFSAPFLSPAGYATFSQTLILSSGVTTT